MKTISLASPRGFCGGVKAALAAFDRTLQEHGAPIYILHELVHNRQVTENLKHRGAIFVDQVEEVPENATLLLGAHGVPPEVERAAAARKLQVVDATCALVKKVQQTAAQLAPEQDLILFGTADHPEVLSVIGHAGTKKIHLLETASDAVKLPEKLSCPVLLSQTTRNHHEVDALAAQLRTRYPDLQSHAGVCTAVFERQQAVEKLAEKSDWVLICGSPHSSNASRLVEIARASGSHAALIDGDAPLPPEIASAERIGIGSGASTPESSVANLLQQLFQLKFTLVGAENLPLMDIPSMYRLCAEMRETILQGVSANGGHLSAALGCVELICALHKVFNVPQEPLVFDVGHQAHAHKLLSGRWEKFATVRTTGGISGFPSALESPADTGISGHAGSAISLAIGIAEGRRKANLPGKVVAVVGDASLWNGVSLEGLNSAAKVENLVIVLNDNKMAISPNVGAFSRYLNRLISQKTYNRWRDKLRHWLEKYSHEKFQNFASRIDDAIKSALMPPGTLFQELGIRYVGPLNGHSLEELIPMLQWIRETDGPILLHVLTQKGKGYAPAEKEPTRYHGVGKFNPATGLRATATAPDFSAVFGRKLCQLAESHPELDAITAAMPDGTGLSDFKNRYPDRFYDVGIAEEHALTFAAGLATAGRRPVCALYSTFAQRALDCFYHDVVLAKLPVILALDRCGIVPDGPTHHGIYDLGFLREMPDVEILCPATAEELTAMLDYLMTLKVPAVIRYPRGVATNRPLTHPVERGKAEILRDGQDVAIWALGNMVELAEKTAELLQEQGVSAAVINPRFIAPFDEETARNRADVLQVTIEDHSVSGGLNAALNAALTGRRHAPILGCGWPDRIIPHGDPAEIRAQFELDPPHLAQKIRDFIAQNQR